MTPSDAAYRTVHDYAGGAESLASRMGMSATILRAKVNPNDLHHKLTLDESDRLMGITGNSLILDALAQAHSYVAIAVDANATSSDLAVLEMVTRVWRENGEIGRSIDDVLADGRVERRELIGVRDHVYQLHKALATLISRLEDMAE